MGCTSSAPTIATPDANATTGQGVSIVQNINEKDLKDQNKTTKGDQNESNDANVLPKCDILLEPIPVVRNNKCLDSDLHCVENVKENQEKENNNENKNGHIFMDGPQNDKISSLEEVVERVIENNVVDIHKGDKQNSKGEEQENHSVKESNDNNSNTQETTENILETDDAMNESEDNTQKDEHVEEAISPSQSEASRVTRWEALADIAAELPPSLAVDPITGQIYALSK